MSILKTSDSSTNNLQLRLRVSSNQDPGSLTHPREPWISLLILQPSPFCNINCDYCYLPGRTLTKRMPMAILERTIHQVYASQLVRDELSIVWHAGEPLAVPMAYYQEAFAVIKHTAPQGATIRHVMQSNGTLINKSWCTFIKGKNISIGLSIDGPAAIHDAHRKTRQGQGTHAATIRGAQLLQKHGIPFHIICVVSERSLDHAEEIFVFFRDHGITQIGFNVEELEGSHTHSSLYESRTADQRIRHFFQTIFDLQKNEGGKIRIREFDAALAKITNHPSYRNLPFPYYNEQVRPLGILSVDCDGNFSTYSPELLGMKSPDYGDFSFGNIQTDSLASALESEKFQQIFADVHAGVKLCESSCSYYGFCGGGAPANKYYENGTFRSTETKFCKYVVQLPLDLVTEDLEATLLERETRNAERTRL